MRGLYLGLTEAWPGIAHRDFEWFAVHEKDKRSENVKTYLMGLFDERHTYFIIKG